MSIVLLSRDLMLVSRLSGVADQMQLESRTVGNAEGAVEACRANECQLLLVDLKLPGLDIAALVEQVRGASLSHVPIVACGPHVHEANLAAAREAGCDLVISRGQFDRQLGDILQDMCA